MAEALPQVKAVPAAMAPLAVAVETAGTAEMPQVETVAMATSSAKAAAAAVPPQGMVATQATDTCKAKVAQVAKAVGPSAVVAVVAAAAM